MAANPAHQLQAPAMKKFTQEELHNIRAHMFPRTGNDSDFARCIAVTEQYGLSPFLGEIHYVERSEKNDNDQYVKKIVPMVGRDGYITIAHKSGRYDGGIRSWSELKLVPMLQPNGSFQLKEDLTATAEVFQVGAARPTSVTVYFHEYAAKSRSGNLTNMWKTKSSTMLTKCAESQALRKAFSIHGLYSAEEMGTGETDGNRIIFDPESVNVTAGDKKKGDTANGQAGSTTAGTVSNLFINDDQLRQVKTLMFDTKANGAAFCQAYNITSLDKLPTALFTHAITALEKKKAALVTKTDNPSGETSADTSQANDDGTINSQQFKVLKDLFNDTRTVEEAFCQAYKITSLATLPAVHFNHAKATLEMKLAKMTNATNTSGQTPSKTSQENNQSQGSSPAKQKLLAALEQRTIPFTESDGGIIKVKPSFGDAAARKFLTELGGFHFVKEEKVWAHDAL